MDSICGCYCGEKSNFQWKRKESGWGMVICEKTTQAIFLILTLMTLLLLVPSH